MTYLAYCCAYISLRNEQYLRNFFYKPYLDGSQQLLFLRSLYCLFELLLSLQLCTSILFIWVDIERGSGNVSV